MSKKVKDVSNEDINPYELDKLSKVPSWLVILILKYWAAAAAVFFIAIGGIDIGFDFSQNQFTDYASIMAESFILVVLIALFTAIFINYIVRPLTRLMYNRRNNTFRYNMINMKGFKSFILALIYSFAITIILFFITMLLSYKGWVLNVFGRSDGGIEPFTYALCFIVVDAIFLLIKNLIIMLYERIKYKMQIRGE